MKQIVISPQKVKGRKAPQKKTIPWAQGESERNAIQSESATKPQVHDDFKSCKHSFIDSRKPNATQNMPKTHFHAGKDPEENHETKEEKGIKSLKMHQKGGMQK